MAISEEETDILNTFGPEANKPEIISALQSICKIHAITIYELFVKWEQFSIKHVNSNINLSLTNIDQFKRYLQAQIEKHANSSIGNVSISSNNNSNPSSAIKNPRVVKSLNNGSSLFGFNVPRTPTLNKKRKLESDPVNDSNIKLKFTEGEIDSSPISFNSVSKPDTPFASNSTSIVESGKIIDTLNISGISVAEGLVSLKDDELSKVLIQPFYDPTKYKFRTMRQVLNDA